MVKNNMGKTALFYYALGKVDPSTKTMIYRELYGYKDLSNHGKYTYKRKGVLETIKHKKNLGSMIILKQEDASKLIKIFKKYYIKYYKFNIK